MSERHIRLSERWVCLDMKWRCPLCNAKHPGESQTALRNSLANHMSSAHRMQVAFGGDGPKTTLSEVCDRHRRLLKHLLGKR